MKEMSLLQIARAYRDGQRVFREIELLESADALFLGSENLSGVEFHQCNLDSASFKQVDLSGAVFSESNLKLVTFDRCNLSGTFWNECLVCSLAIGESETNELRVTKVEAYGAQITDAEDFLEGAAYKWGERRA